MNKRSFKFSKYEPSILDKIFIRNYAILFLIIVLCTGTVIYILYSGDRQIGKIDERVKHAQTVIVEAGQISALLEGMLSAQRGYLITSNADFLQEYENTRSVLMANIDRLLELVAENKSQKKRIEQMRSDFTKFSALLEMRAKEHQSLPSAGQISLADFEIISDLKENMVNLNNEVLEEEYGLLNYRIDEVNRQKSKYFVSLLIGLVLSAAMLLVFNGFLLHAQRRSIRIEASLKDTEARFALAAEGTQDGIFDWDLIRNEIFYSKPFYGMLGQEREAFIGKFEELTDAMHPEDKPRVMQHIKEYLGGEHTEYAQEFRLRHAHGHWIWVQSRAKVILDKKGTPIRMVGAHTNISHIKKEQARLESEKKEAENANRAKSDFLAHMSHEIRTPLTAISGIAEIFEKNQSNLTDTQKKLVYTLYSSTLSLKDLTNDILDFSKIESGELELIEEAFNLDTLFRDVTNMMSVRANQKKLQFTFDYQDVRGVDFLGDKLRIRQILVNLIGNALKFTTQGAVTVKAYPEVRDGEVFLRVDVADTGIGIASENFDLIFERFKQADASGSRKYGGTGLGLAISKNLANQMEGKILLVSELGVGSTFSLLVPHKQADSKAVDLDDSARGRKLSERIRMSLNENSRILLVEDSEGNIVVLSHFLEEHNFPYDVARTGIIALDYWRNGHYDIILMDVQMPEMDGFVTTRIIRDMEKDGGFPRTPIVGMTAHALIGDKDKCIAAGMDAYLPKPIVEVDLKYQILKYLNFGKKA